MRGRGPAGAAAAAERRRRRHYHDGLYAGDPDGRYHSATAGTHDHDEPPEAEAATLVRFEGPPQLRRIAPSVPVSSHFLKIDSRVEPIRPVS